MATSGSTSFTQVRDQIIMRAGRQVGAWAAGETPSNQEIQDWAVALNAMVKEWEAIGIHVWAEVQGACFLVPNQIQYTLGPDSTDNVTESFIATKLAENASTQSATISVLSLNGLSVGMNIGLYLNAQTLFWSTIESVQTSDGSYLVTMAAEPPSLASVGNPVVSYSTVIARPLRILAYRRRDLISGLETPIQIFSRLDYEDLPNKMTPGSLNGCFYDPQLNDGVLNIWQNPITAQYAAVFTWMRQIQDFANPTDTPDFPQEWINCLTWNLAEQMLPEYNLANPIRVQYISNMAAKTLDHCTGWDKEPESYYLGVNFDESAR